MLSREQRIRKEAQLQSLYTSLANYRKQEVTYIENAAAIPMVLINQINEARHEIIQIEGELFSPSSQPSKHRAGDYYQQAVEAELAGDLNAALKLYRSAGRHGHADANAAMRRIRYQQKQAKSKPANNRIPLPVRQSKNRLIAGLAGLVIILLIITTIALGGRSPAEPPNVAAIESSATPIISPTPELIVPHTATPLPVETPTLTTISVSIPTSTPQPALTQFLSTATPVPSPVPTLMAAPKIVDPKDGMVWGDGTVVFEFVDMDLADNELYCLSTMRGYDITNTENWSHPPRGSKQPYIVVEANVFRVARSQGMRCVVWSAYIGRDSCKNVVSEITLERVIGMPRPCDFGK